MEVILSPILKSGGNAEVFNAVNKLGDRPTVSRVKRNIVSDRLR